MSGEESKETPAVPATAPVVSAVEATPAINPLEADLKAARAELEQLRPLAGQVKEANETLASHAQSLLSELSPEWQAHIRAVAGDDPKAQLKALASAKSLIKPTTVLPPPGATTAAPSAPKAPGAQVDPDTAALLHYESLKKAGANLLAAQYKSANAGAIARAEARTKQATPN